MIFRLVQKGLIGFLGVQVVTAGLAAQELNEPPYYAIENARIVTGTSNSIANGTIVLERGLITAVGSNVSIPPDAWRIDGSGLSVYPGLIDSLTDLGLRSAGAKVQGNLGRLGENQQLGSSEKPYSTGPEDRPGTFTWKKAADEISHEDSRLSKWRRAGFTSAISAPTKGIFPGQAAFINLAGKRGRELVVAAPVAFPVKLKDSGGYRGFPGALMGVISYVKQTFFDARYYGDVWAAYEKEPRGRERPIYDRTLAPLAIVQQEGLPILIPGSWAKEIRRAIRLGREAGARTVIYGAHQGYSAVDTLRKTKTPVLVSAKWPTRSKDADPNVKEALRVLRMRDQAPSTPKALEEAGVGFAFYSDGMNDPKEFIRNVSRAIEAGLPKAAAVRALTINAAKIFGVADRLGSLESGKIANLLVTEGELFEENTVVQMVFVDGRRYVIHKATEVQGKETGWQGAKP